MQSRQYSTSAQSVHHISISWGFPIRFWKQAAMTVQWLWKPAVLHSNITKTKVVSAWVLRRLSTYPRKPCSSQVWVVERARVPTVSSRPPRAAQIPLWLKLLLRPTDKITTAHIAIKFFPLLVTDVGTKSQFMAELLLVATVKSQSETVRIIKENMRKSAKHFREINFKEINPELSHVLCVLTRSFHLFYKDERV